MKNTTLIAALVVVFWFYPVVYLHSNYQEWSEFSAILKPSKIPDAGVGVFATHDIKKGARVFTHIAPWTVASHDEVPDVWQGHVNSIDDKYCMRPERFDHMGIECYINHSFTPNIISNANCEWVAARDIKKGEEFTFDYSLTEVAETPEEAYYAK